VTARPWQNEDEIKMLKQESLNQKSLSEDTAFHGI